MLCFAVVVTYNGAKWIDKCIRSLVNSTIPLNVIVIDNNSNDGTPKIIQQNFPEVELIESRQNLGFGKANNIGIKRAYESGADYVFLLNQDAWVEQETIEKLAKIAERFPEYGIVSPVHLNDRGSAFDYGFLNYLCRNGTRDYLSDFYCKPRDELAEIYQLDFVNASFWLLTRKTIEMVGGFNPFFLHYGEDRDYVNRCHFFDLKVGFVPFANAYHARIQQDSETKKDNLPRFLTLVELFNPCNDVTVNTHIRSLWKPLIKNLLRFKFRQVKYLVAELGFFCSNRKTITAISLKLKKTGSTFLD